MKTARCETLSHRAVCCDKRKLRLLSHHHLAGLVDVAAAEGDDQIALPGVLLDPLGGLLQTVHQNRAGDLSGQFCTGNGGICLLYTSDAADEL